MTAQLAPQKLCNGANARHVYSAKVLVASSQPGTTFFVAHLLKSAGFSVLGCYTSAAEWFNAITDNPADVLVFDPLLIGANSPLDMLDQTRKRTKARLIVYSPADMPILASAYLEHGAHCIVSGRSGSEVLRRALEAAEAGHMFLDPAIDEASRAFVAWNGLTECERSLAKALIAGHTIKGFTVETNRHPSTVYDQKNSLLKKLGLRTERQLVGFAYEHGLNYALNVERTGCA